MNLWEIKAMNPGVKRRQELLKFLKGSHAGISFSIPVNRKYCLPSTDKDLVALEKKGLIERYRIHYGKCQAQTYFMLTKKGHDLIIK